MLIALIATISALSAFAVSSATAGLPTNSKNGSKAYVTDNQDCSPIEANKITAGDTLYLVSNQDVSLDWTLYSQGTSSKNSTIIDSGVADEWTLCDGATNLWYTTLDIDTSELDGTYTLETNYTDTGKNFSSDSFQVVPAPAPA